MRGYFLIVRRNLDPEEPNSNKFKVCPVLDFHELNGYVDMYTANADAFPQKLWESLKKGSSVLLLDLQKAYLLVHVHQLVVVINSNHCRKEVLLDTYVFGLNMTTSIMRAIVDAALSKNFTIQ